MPGLLLLALELELIGNSAMVVVLDPSQNSGRKPTHAMGRMLIPCVLLGWILLGGALEARAEEPLLESPVMTPMISSDVTAQAVPEEASSSCLLADKLICRLTGQYRAVEIESQYGELVARLERLGGTHDVVSLRGFLREQDLDSNFAADEDVSSDVTPLSTNSAQMAVWQEQLGKFEKLQGARYEIPANSAELKTSLGFDPQVEIAASDWLDVLQVQLERTLGVDPEISESLVELLGVEAAQAPEAPQVPEMAQVPVAPASSDPVVVETN